MRHAATFAVHAGERVPFVLTWFPSHHRAPAARRCRACPRRDRGAMALVVRAVQVRGRLRRGGSRIAGGPEGALVRADRRHRRRTDDVAAGGDRRRPQLGLPLHLAARRDVHAVRVDERGLHRRGPRLAQLASPRRRGRPRERADPLRRRRRAARAGARARVAARLRGLGAGADRKRRARAVPARRVRRGDGRAAPGAGRGPAGRRPCLVAAARDHGLPRGRLGAAGRGDLGGARPAAPLHALEGARLGRVRPRGRHGRALRPARPGRPLAPVARRGAPRGLPRGVQRRAQLVHAGVRVGRARRLDPADPARRLPARRRSDECSARSTRSSAT